MSVENVHRVILVHGTGAGDQQNEGALWWQRGSEFWAHINTRLAPFAVCWPHEATVACFHWGRGTRHEVWKGPNLETERLKAGRDLLENWLLPIEAKGERYHLIGHSHGGSVIWAALREAEERGIVLQHLASWTTIGTPFLHYRAARFTAWELAGLFLSGAALSRSGWHVFIDFWSAPIELLVSFVMCLVVFFYFFFRIAAVLRACGRVRRDAVYGRKAFERYQDRWLGLYSQADEAINGLNATIGRTFKAIARIEKWPGFAETAWRPIGGIFPPLNWLCSLGSHPWGFVYHCLWGPFFNRWVAPEVDRFVYIRLADKCHGNDRSGFTLEAVTRGPLPGLVYEPIPDEIDQQLRADADTHAAELVRSVRSLLGLVSPMEPDLGQILGPFEGKLSWKELVHTTYYHHPDVRELLALHIGQGLPIHAVRNDEIAQRLTAWRAKLGPPQPEPQDPSTAASRRSTWLRDVFEPRWLRPYVSGLACILIPLLLWWQTPTAWYRELSAEQMKALRDPEMEPDHPLLKAVRNDDVPALDYFLRIGAKRDAKTAVRGDTLFLDAINHNSAHVVLYLYRHGETFPVQDAAILGSRKMAKLLIDNGADVNAPNDTSFRTPLHYAVTNGNLNMVEFLMENGALPLKSIIADGEVIVPSPCAMIDDAEVSPAVLGPVDSEIRRKIKKSLRCVQD